MDGIGINTVGFGQAPLSWCGRSCATTVKPAARGVPVGVILPRTDQRRLSFFPPIAAMRLLVAMALAHQQRGWPTPDGVATGAGCAARSLRDRCARSR